jgi:hypothetical protein
MANQTVTTVVNYDDASIAGLLDGETLTINGGTVTIDADVRWNQQAAVLGAVTLSATLGGILNVDGTKVWEIPFSASSGNVPAQAALGSNGVTGGTSGATGELTRVWATGTLTPVAAGGAMPATGFIKLRTKTGTFEAGETITLPGGATITAVDAGKRSWIHVVGREGSIINIPRLGSAPFTGDWYELGTTNGADDQTFQLPVADEIPAFQMETSPGSGNYEWWLNAGQRWHGVVIGVTSISNNGTTATLNNIAPPSYSDPFGFLAPGRRLRETATTAVHVSSVATSANGANNCELGTYTLRTYIKKETRRYGFASITDGTTGYGVIVDFDAAGAVVATPTVGSPTGTGNTIIDAGGGWYRVDLTFAHTVLANSLTCSVGMSDSATPTYNAGRPSYAGSTSEGMYYSELQLISPTSIQHVNSTDERGKFFFANPQTGVITIAQRTGRIAGLKPASGCAVRIPNIICSNSNAIDYNLNTAAVGGARFAFFTDGSGPISISGVVSNWSLSFNNPYSVDVQNSAALLPGTSNCATTTVFNNVACGASRDDNVSGSLGLSACQFGATITDCVATTFTTAIRSPLGISGCRGVTVTRFIGRCHGGFMGRTSRAGVNNQGLSIANSANCKLIDCTSIGCPVIISTSSNTEVTNHKYAERTVGATETTDGGYALLLITTVTDTVIDGVSLIPGLTNVHPYTGVLQLQANVRGTVIKNIGTPAAPFDCGSANATLNPFQFGNGAVFDTLIQRCYFQNINGTRPVIVSALTNKIMRLLNVWGDAADVYSGSIAAETIAQGCRWSKDTTGNFAVYGSHWEDAFTGTDRGRITISGNEPTPATADQCSATFGALAGFTASGSAALPNVGDKIVWTMPYYALGHTGIAKFDWGVDANDNWNIAGTNPQHFEFRYQIDPGTGTFSAWKWMLSTIRRASGGTSGTNTVTLTTADRTPLTRQPAIGDYVQTAIGRLPAGTTVTNVAGDVITTSNNFASSVSAGEGVYFWKDIANETISPTLGYKLKVELNTTIANATNVFGQLRIPFDTNATDQQVQYPLPTNASGTVTGLFAGSRVVVWNETEDTIIHDDIVAGTSLTINYDDGDGVTAGDTIRVYSVWYNSVDGSTASKKAQGIAVATATGYSVILEMEYCTTYADYYATYSTTGAAVDASGDFVRDVAGLHIDLDDSDNTWYAHRAFMWDKYDLWFNSGRQPVFREVTATDSANLSIGNLFLDNLNALTAYQGDPINVVNATSTLPVVNPTTGGGGITMYSGGKILTTATGGIAPSEAQIKSWVRAELAAEMARIDVATSTRLASASYVSPDNAGVSAIKAKTDSLAFTVAGQVDANIQYVNDVAVSGVGSEADPWNPA